MLMTSPATTPPARRPAYPRIEEIQRVVARSYGVTRHDLLSDRRTVDVVRPRQVAMYLAKVLTPHSYPVIGRSFRRCDGTTVLHAVRKIERLVGTEFGLRQRIDELARPFGGRHAVENA